MSALSTTIRVSKSDKERLSILAKRLNVQSMAEALRIAVTAAEEQDEKFVGNLAALRETLRHTASAGGNISENVDDEVARAPREQENH